MPNENKIYVINRDQYDDIRGNLQEKSIYLVKENAASGNRLLSMYLGALRTTDVMDISDYVDYNNDGIYLKKDGTKEKIKKE